MIYWKIISLTFKEQSIAHFKTKVTKFVKISENEAVKNISAMIAIRLRIKDQFLG
jgi:hypothetical protein